MVRVFVIKRCCIIYTGNHFSKNSSKRLGSSFVLIVIKFDDKLYVTILYQILDVYNNITYLISNSQ